MRQADTVRARSVTGTLLRVAVGALAAEVALQPVFAGQALSGNGIGYAGHAMLGYLVIPLTALVVLVASVLAWRPGGAPAWIPAAGAGLFLAIGIQGIAGNQRLLALHIPLGVAIVVLTLWLLTATGRKPSPHDPSQGPHGPGAGLRPGA